MPRKSTENTAAQAKDQEDGGSASKPPKADHKGLSVEELNLPRSMVQRLAKGMLPLNTSIQKDALLALSKSATVFVSYLASNANDRAVLNNKKTIQPADVFAALSELEFQGFIPRVQEELELYNKDQCEKRNTYRKRVKQVQQPSDSTKSKEGGDDGDEGGRDEGFAVNGRAGADRDSAHDNGDVRMEDEPPASKKARLSNDMVHHDDDNALNGENDDEGDTIDDNEADDQELMEEDEGDEDEDHEVEEGESGDDQEDGLEEPANDPGDDEENEDSLSD